MVAYFIAQLVRGKSQENLVWHPKLRPARFANHSYKVLMFSAKRADLERQADAREWHFLGNRYILWLKEGKATCQTSPKRDLVFSSQSFHSLRGPKLWILRMPVTLVYFTIKKPSSEGNPQCSKNQRYWLRLVVPVCFSSKCKIKTELWLLGGSELQSFS